MSLLKNLVEIATLEAEHAARRAAPHTVTINEGVK